VILRVVPTPDAPYWIKDLEGKEFESEYARFDPVADEYVYTASYFSAWIPATQLEISED
jgi:hypothetical protein